MTEFICTIHDLVPMEDGRTCISYTVDYNGQSSGITVAEGTDFTEATAKAHIASLYN